MGYFSNRTEFEYWAVENCQRCVHQPDNYDNDPIGCPVEFLHVWWNYDAVGKDADPVKAEALNTLIPLAPNGAGNESCRLFYPRRGTK